MPNNIGTFPPFILHSIFNQDKRVLNCSHSLFPSAKPIPISELAEIVRKKRRKSKD